MRGTVFTVSVVLAIVCTVHPLHAQTPANLSIGTYAGLTITGAVGTVYSIEYVTDLAHTNTPSAWRCLEYLQLPASPYLWADKSAPATGQRFYQAVVYPAPTNMVFIPPVTFTMGSPETEAERNDDETQHEVTLSRGFWMGKCEVTQGEYLDLIGTNPSYFQNGTLAWSGGAVTDELHHPIEQVTWFDAKNYCAILTRREIAAGRLPNGYIYRLPTEAEWAYAGRAGTTTAFYFGDELRSGMANFRGTNEY